MPVHQLDSFSPPSDATLEQAKAAGVQVWPGYTGGPEAAISWPADGFVRIRNHGLRAPAIYVGLGTPEEAVAQAQARGVPQGEVIWHDIETGWSMSHDTPAFAIRWVTGVLQAGYIPGLYGTAAFVNQWGHFYRCVWAAGGSYYRNGPGSNPWPATPLQVPACTPAGTPCGVQWWATHNEFGIGVDRSIMDDLFGHSNGDVMDAQHEQQLLEWVAFRQYVDALIRVPESVDAMVARANRIALVGAISSQWEMEQSTEGKGKPGGMLAAIFGSWTRLAAVEQHLADLGKKGATETGTYNPAPVHAEVDAIRREMAEHHKALAVEYREMAAMASSK